MHWNDDWIYEKWHLQTETWYLIHNRNWIEPFRLCSAHYVSMTHVFFQSKYRILKGKCVSTPHSAICAVTWKHISEYDLLNNDYVYHIAFSAKWRNRDKMPSENWPKTRFVFVFFNNIGHSKSYRKIIQTMRFHSISLGRNRFSFWCNCRLLWVGSKRTRLRKKNTCFDSLSFGASQNDAAWIEK